MNYIGNRLRFLREKKGYTQKYIADKLHISRSTYSYYESGKCEPSLDSIIIISEIYEISLDVLLKKRKKRKF